MWEWIKEATGPVTYSLPGAPPAEHRVRDRTGRVFVREPWAADQYGLWVLVADSDGPTETDLRYSWGALLAYGPLTLLEFTEQEKADALVYGPPGARWGEPTVKCGYKHLDARFGTPPWGECALGFGHIAPHRDSSGNALGETEADGTLVPRMARISLQEAAEVPCTCGHPGRHQPECSRYGRTVGGSSDGH